jgi:division protein CdvB (Snf7/Vps24/ESCRT-III family)
VEDELKPIALEMVQNLHELSVCIEEFAATTVYDKLEPVKYGELSKEAEKILLEAQRNAVEIVKNKFPDIPTLNENEIKIYAYISKMVVK